MRRFLFVAVTTAAAAAAVVVSASTATTSVSTNHRDLVVQEKGGVSKLEGVELPNTKDLNGTSLIRNGQGVRSIPFLGLNIKIYVAGFYTPRPLRSLKDVMTAENDNMILDFTFLRSVGQSRVTEAWRKQLAASVSAESKYDGYEQDRDRFISLFGPIAYGGTETVQLLGNGNTVIIDQGVVKGTIKGRAFQRAFLSMWFGEQPVASDLKDGLLGSHETTLVL